MRYRSEPSRAWRFMAPLLLALPGPIPAMADPLAEEEPCVGVRCELREHMAAAARDRTWALEPISAPAEGVDRGVGSVHGWRRVPVSEVERWSEEKVFGVGR